MIEPFAIASKIRVTVVSLLVCSLLQSSLAMPACAAVAEVEEINRQILLKEIELERFSINFRKYNNIQGRWRGWRYFVFQEANAGMTAAGLTKQLVDRHRVIENANIYRVDSSGKVSYASNGVDRVTQEKGLLLQMLGQTVGAIGSGIELGINIHHGRAAHKKGYGTKDSINFVLALRQDIKDLFAQRAKAVAAAHLEGNDLAIAQAEENVLRDITDMGLQEYSDYHIAAKKFRAFQDSLYIFDIAKNTTGAVGNLVNIVQTHEQRPHLSGGAGVLTLTSGALIMFTPLLAQGVGKIVAASHKKAMGPVVAGISPHTVDELEIHRSQLNSLLSAQASAGGSSTCSSKSVALLSAYDLEASQRRKQFALATREIRAGTRSATENTRAGLFVGSTKVALGVTNMVAGWHLTHHPHKVNSLLQGGTIAYASGAYFAVGENLRLRIVDEVNRKKLGARFELPSQVLSEKIKALDQLETQLKACSAGKKVD